jgi:phage tail sheath gpL-like
MSIPVFNFTRNPSVKVSVATAVSGLAGADNQLILVGRVAAAGGTVAVGAPTIINNYGDPVAAQTECDGYFGAGSEIGEMVVAAIKAVLYSSLQNKVYPPIKVYPMANAAASSTLSAFLANFLAMPAPYMAIPYAADDSAALTALSSFMTAISSSDRGDNGQFGSFGFAATILQTSSATPVGVAAASSNLVLPWLRDTATTPANSVHQVSAAMAAISACMGVPFNSLNGVSVGGLVAPSSHADWHTPGDAGTVALGLSAGLVPLQVLPSGMVAISRAITASRVVSSIQDIAYYDLQDWQVLYYCRKVFYNIAMQPRYRQAKASIQVLLALKSELISACKDMESIGMLQFVSKFADQFTVNQLPGNRNAAVYSVPMNVIPVLANIGIAITGTTQFDGTGL